MTLPEGASLQATEREAHKLAGYLANDSNVEGYSYYVGQAAPRFVLVMTPNMVSDSNYAQFIIVAKDVKARTELSKKINKLFAENFESIRGHISFLQLGAPDPYPVMLRVSGYDPEKVRMIANQVRDSMFSNPNVNNINFDWNEKNKIMLLDIDQDKAKLLGLSSNNLAVDLQTQLSGKSISAYREQDKTVGVILRMDYQSRKDLSLIKDMPIHIGNGKFIPLNQIAKIRYDAEEGLIWRRDLKPTITVQADVADGVTGVDATTQVYGALNDIRKNLPPGYSIDIGGALERSKKSISFLVQPVPIMILIIITLLMFQLQKISLTVLTLLTAPLGIIGVSIGMLVTQRPMGFVSEMGILALSGMIIRNSVILIDQIEKNIKAGQTPWNAIIESATQRFRPIMLTAAAAILGMIPLAASNFWGPMAVAIAGGLFGATVLTLLVLPTMYAAWFKVKFDGVDRKIKEQQITHEV